MTGKLLIIEDEPRLRNNLKLLLASEGYTVASAADGEEGIQCLQQASYDLVITDVRMGKVSGFHVMEYITSHVPETLVIVITGNASTESAIEALRQGAYDYITKPFEIDMIQVSIERALEKVRLQRALTQYTQDLEQRVAVRTAELEETNRKLQVSLAELKNTQEQLIQTEKLSALGELISGFAHELNNPLGAVVGYAELLTAVPECPDKVSSKLDKLCQEAMRCHQIVQNLLSFARKQKPEKQYLSINPVCLKTVELLDYQFKINNIKTETQLEAHLPMTMVDAHQLQQVLVNLLSNAYQAMAEHHGGGRLTVATTYDGGKIYITVTDTGPGITAEHIHRIFDPFFTTKETGTGLGMSLSYGLIKEHGGDITISSPPGQGATFTIELPITQEAASHTKSSKSPDVPLCPSMKVLVIDDEQNLADMLVTVLESMGHQAEALLSSREALQKIAHEAYDLIICDMKMPEVDGQQVYQFIKSHHPALINRLILSSGDTVSDEQQAFLHVTQCLLLPKPFLQKDLRQIIYQASRPSVS